MGAWQLKLLKDRNCIFYIFGSPLLIIGRKPSYHTIKHPKSVHMHAWLRGREGSVDALTFFTNLHSYLLRLLLVPGLTTVRTPGLRVRTQIYLRGSAVEQPKVKIYLEPHPCSPPSAPTSLTLSYGFFCRIFPQ